MLYVAFLNRPLPFRQFKGTTNVQQEVRFTCTESCSACEGMYDASGENFPQFDPKQKITLMMSGVWGQAGLKLKTVFKESLCYKLEVWGLQEVVI